jgi:hypothetical protein
VIGEKASVTSFVVRRFIGRKLLTELSHEPRRLADGTLPLPELPDGIELYDSYADMAVANGVDPGDPALHPEPPAPAPPRTAPGVHGFTPRCGGTPERLRECRSALSRRSRRGQW